MLPKDSYGFYYPQIEGTVQVVMELKEGTISSEWQ